MFLCKLQGIFQLCNIINCFVPLSAAAAHNSAFSAVPKSFRSVAALPCLVTLCSSSLPFSHALSLSCCFFRLVVSPSAVGTLSFAATAASTARLSSSFLTPHSLLTPHGPLQLLLLLWSLKVQLWYFICISFSLLVN